MKSDRCKNIVCAISVLGQTQTEELFKILHKNRCEYTKNNNGVFINLSWLTDDMLDKIEKYVAFCNKSQIEVKKYESLCDVLNKNIIEYKSEEPQESEHRMFYTEQFARQDKRISASKVSSSMKFYLLKKRFSKQTPMVCHLRNDLKIEPYII